MLTNLREMLILIQKKIFLRPYIENYFNMPLHNLRREYFAAYVLVYPEDGGSKILRNAGIVPHHYAA
jgi:hypothetical protein